MACAISPHYQTSMGCASMGEVHVLASKSWDTKSCVFLQIFTNNELMMQYGWRHVGLSFDISHKSNAITSQNTLMEKPHEFHLFTKLQLLCDFETHYRGFTCEHFKSQMIKYFHTLGLIHETEANKNSNNLFFHKSFLQLFWTALI